MTYRGYARHAIERGTPDRLADRERRTTDSATAPTRGYAYRDRDRDTSTSPGSATRRTNAGLGTTGFGKKPEGRPSDDSLRFVGTADRGTVGGTSGIRGTGGGSVTGGGSLPGRLDAGLDRKPRTLKPAPNAKTRGLGAGSGADRSFTPSGATAGRGAKSSGGSGIGTSDLGRGAAGVGHDYTHRKKLESEGRYGEKYGGNYYEKNRHGKHHDHRHGHGYYPYYPYYYGYYDCWPYGYYGYPSFGFGYYGSWYFGLSWCWPFYYSYGSYWPYTYAYGYPFHRVYHYGYTSYCPDRVVVYENYYENYYEGGGGVVYEDGVPVEGGAPATAPAELPEDPLVTGDVLLRAGKYEEAVEAYRKVVEDEPDNSVAKFALADALFAVGKYNESTYTLRLGLMQDPEWLDATVNKGDIFPTAEEFERLLDELEAYATERPFDSSAWYLLGFQQYFHNRFDAAETSLRRADEVLPGDDLTGRTIEKVTARRAAFEAAKPDPERKSATAPPERTAKPAVASEAAPAEASDTTPERKDLEE